ncbi:ribokinase [Olsenella urininfantis]|uniref:ribokinase n=1 Tax=Olsenella urininfantis TaxID=1871033 RepID=UPI000986431A|nr:ribokinase [Olsenella urininfantis]
MRILNFGSLNIDFVYDVDHFVRPGETISSRALGTYPGGKGLNQSIALARAGASVVHAGQVGEDGRFLVELLEESGVDASLTRVSTELRTGNAIIQRDAEGNNCIILYGGANQDISSELTDELLSQMQPEDWLLLQNEVNGLAHIVRAGKARGMKVVLNPSPANEALEEVDLAAVDLFVLNEVEAAQLAGLDEAADAGELVGALGRRFPTAEIVLTLGEEGSVLASGDVLLRQEAFSVPVVDTTAAGDTFTGYLLAGMLAGERPEVFMRRASAASALAVTRPGAAVSIPRSDEVDEFIARL